MILSHRVAALGVGRNDVDVLYMWPARVTLQATAFKGRARQFFRPGPLTEQPFGFRLDSRRSYGDGQAAGKRVSGYSSFVEERSCQNFWVRGRADTRL
jgi:hypothetical protein